MCQRLKCFDTYFETNINKLYLSPCCLILLLQVRLWFRKNSVIIIVERRCEFETIQIWIEQSKGNSIANHVLRFTLFNPNCYANLGNVSVFLHPAKQQLPWVQILYRYQKLVDFSLRSRIALCCYHLFDFVQVVFEIFLFVLCVIFRLILFFVLTQVAMITWLGIVEVGFVSICWSARNLISCRLLSNN